MSDQNLYLGPPNWAKFAIAGKEGWINANTGEVLISIGNYFTLRPEYLNALQDVPVGALIFVNPLNTINYMLRIGI